MAFTHAFVSAKADGANATKVRKTNWNAEHVGDNVLDRDTSVITKGSTSAVESLYSFTVPAAAMGANGGIRLTVNGTYTNNTGSDRTLKFALKFGGSIIKTSNAFTLEAGSSAREWHLEVLTLNLTDSTQWWAGLGLMGTHAGGSFIWGNTTTTPPNFTLTAIAFASSVDTSGTTVIELTSQHSISDAALSIEKRLGMVELVAPTV